MDQIVYSLEGTHEQKLTAFNLIQKLLQNILKNLNNEKFRQINPQNATLQQKLFNIKNIEKFLGAIGFMPDGQYNYQNQDTFILQMAIKEVQNVLQDINDEINLNPEQLKKHLLLKQQKLEQSQEEDNDKKQKERLIELSNLDRKEVKQHAEVKDSIGNEIKFGRNEAGVVHKQSR